jgi:uncharacterized protein
MSNDNLPQLPPSGIGEAAKYNFEPWFIKIRFQDQSPLEERYWKDATKPLGVLQSTIGNEFEDYVYDELDKKAHTHVNTWYDWDSDENKNQIIEEVEKVANRKDGKPTILTQARLKGTIKLFDVLGDADLIILFPTDDGVHINVIDIKASWDEKPYQQLQTATYTVMLRNILSNTEVNYKISGGIIYRETDLDTVLVEENTPSFHLETREGDVKRILKEDGPFERAFTTDFDELPLSVNKSSPYAEVCIVKAIENGDLSLLGLSPGEKTKLKNHNITTIQDVAELYNLIEDSKPYEYDDVPINPKHKETINKLSEEATLSTRLPIIAQKAQAFLGDLNPEHTFAHDKPWFSWLQGVGSAKLPEDNPPYDADLPIKKNSLIRVYLNIQHDHVRDSIVAISGRVTCGLYDSSPLTFSRVVNDINRNADTWGGEDERELLEDAFTDIFKTIQLLGGLNQQDEAGIHFYVYGQDEYDSLYDSVKRHQNTLPQAASMRRLLDGREGIDQKMVSVVESEIENRFAVKQMDTSLTSIVQRTYPRDAYAQFSNSDWEISHSSGSEINLKEAFKQQLFDGFVPISQGGSKLASVLNKNSDNTSADSFYSLLPRSGAQIPIEYLWASDDIGLLDETWSDDDNQKSIIRNFQWVDSSKQDIPITSSMYSMLSSKLAHSLHHVERSISYRSTDMNKEPIELADLPTQKPREGTLAEACRDYLDLEARQTKDDAYDVYMEPVKKRVIDGESVPIRVTNIVQDKGYMFRAVGELLFDEFDFDNPTQIAGSSRIGGSGETTGGTRCVATPLTKIDDEFTVEGSSPNQIARGIKVSVDEYDPKNNRIVIDGYRTSSKLEFEYVLPRMPWSLDASNDHQPYMGSGEMFVLDPNPDNTMAEKSIKALRYADSNPVYQDIQKIRNSQSDMNDTVFTYDGVSKYLNWAEDALEFKPNKKQSEFIMKTGRYSLLQGPPGTGKTSGALAQALMARAFDGQERETRVSSLVTGLSNKSVDEVMADVVELLERFDEEYGTHPLENTRIVRLAYNEPQNSSDKVEYLNYNDENDIDILNNLIMPVGTSHQQTLASSNSNSIEHLIVFGTPGRVDGLVGKLFDGTTAEEGYERAYNFFDALAIDEASMMPMYQLFMASAFVKEDAQIMLAGDQRQLSPVQKYEWQDEIRTSIINHMPHLSALDYFRYLRGEKIDKIHEDSPPSPNANIPMTRLNETFRCHETVTEFLRQTVYDQDGINYVSNQKNTIPEIDIDTDGLRCALKSDAPLTVIIHNDRTSRQVSSVEGTMLSALTKVIPDSESVGIVTPHNAQKGKLKTLCENCDVDTVERFQGGEKDVMFLSTTVSDPAHLSDEEEFILSQNRINVALSRMKKKLVVLVPESLFELVPEDIDIYDEARIWKALYAISAAKMEPEWQGDVGGFSGGGSMMPGSKTNLKVYNIKNI